MNNRQAEDGLQNFSRQLQRLSMLRHQSTVRYSSLVRHYRCYELLGTNSHLHQAMVNNLFYSHGICHWDSAAVRCTDTPYSDPACHHDDHTFDEYVAELVSATTHGSGASYLAATAVSLWAGPLPKPSAAAPISFRSSIFYHREDCYWEPPREGSHTCDCAGSC